MSTTAFVNKVTEAIEKLTEISEKLTELQEIKSKEPNGQKPKVGRKRASSDD